MASLWEVEISFFSVSRVVDIVSDGSVECVWEVDGCEQSQSKAVYCTEEDGCKEDGSWLVDLGSTGETIIWGLQLVFISDVGVTPGGLGTPRRVSQVSQTSRPIKENIVRRSRQGIRNC